MSTTPEERRELDERARARADAQEARDVVLNRRIRRNERVMIASRAMAALIAHDPDRFDALAASVQARRYADALLRELGD